MIASTVHFCTQRSLPESVRARRRPKDQGTEAYPNDWFEGPGPYYQLARARPRLDAPNPGRGRAPGNGGVNGRLDQAGATGPQQDQSASAG